MFLKDVTTPYETHKIIHYSTTVMNKAVTHNFDMQPIGKNVYKGVIEADEYGRKHCDIFAVYPEAPCGVILCKHEVIWDDGNDRTVDYYLDEAHKAGLDTYAGYIAYLKNQMQAGRFVGNVDIAFANQNDTDLAKELYAYREAYIAKQEQKHEEARAKREAEERAFVSERNAEADALIAEAVEIIRNGGRLINKDITIYHARYNSSTYSIINHLARLYGVKIPLRTQGWINSSLTEITVQNGKMASGRYHGKSQSTVIFKYMNALIQAVNNGQQIG